MSHADRIYLFLGFCLLLMPAVLTSGGVWCTAKGVMALRHRQLRPSLLAGILMTAAGLALGWVLLQYIPLSWTEGWPLAG